MAKLILHLAEMSARKTALALGYRSLYDYAIRRLNLSEGAVPARVHVANVSRQFPQLVVALADGRLSLTVASLLAPHLTKDNVDELISDCAGKTRKATEEYLVALKPKPVFVPSIRKQPSSQPNVLERTPIPPRVASPPPVESPKPSPAILQPARPLVFNFRFSAGADFKEKLERLAEVMGVENTQQRMAEILDSALDIALEKKDPKRKLERRKRRRKASSATPRSNEMSDKTRPAQSRYIPSEVTERVHARGEYQCQYTSRDGTRCTARAGLQIEHLRPFAIYRSHDESMLRIYCRQHNRLAAEGAYGASFIQRKIDESRKRRSG